MSKSVESVREHFVSQSASLFEKVSKSVEVGFAVLLEDATTKLRLGLGLRENKKDQGVSPIGLGEQTH